MTDRMDDAQLDREVRSFLAWQAEDVAGAPSATEMATRISDRAGTATAGLRVAPKLAPGPARRSPGHRASRGAGHRRHQAARSTFGRHLRRHPQRGAQNRPRWLRSRSLHFASPERGESCRRVRLGRHARLPRGGHAPSRWGRHHHRARSDRHGGSPSRQSASGRAGAADSGAYRGVRWGLRRALHNAGHVRLLGMEMRSLAPTHLPSATGPSACTSPGTRRRPPTSWTRQ